MSTGKTFLLSNTVSLFIFQQFHTVLQYVLFKSISLLPLPIWIYQYYFPSHLHIPVFSFLLPFSFLNSPVNPGGAASVCIGEGPAMGSLMETVPWKKSDFPSPSTTSALQLEVGLQEPHPSAALVLCRSSAGIRSCCELMCAVSASCPEDSVLQ